VNVILEDGKVITQNAKLNLSSQNTDKKSYTSAHGGRQFIT